MTSLAGGAERAVPLATTRPGPRPAPLPQAVSFELRKMLSQWRVRALLLACWVVPAVFVVGVREQSTVPSDTVFGRWVFTSGWAGSLVVLTSACTWGLPLLVSLVAGDAFAVEDRLGTWRHLLMAVRSPRRIFVAKAVASCVVVGLLLLGLAVSSIGAGLLAIGSTDLVGLDGHVMAAPDAGRAVVLAWVYVAVATLAYMGVGLLGSVLFGRSPTGLLLPAALAFVLQVVQMLPLPVAVRVALPSQAYLSWRWLFTDPVAVKPLVAGIVVNLAWTVLTTLLAYRLFLRRDFTDLTYAGSARRALLWGAVPMAALTAAASVGVLATAPDAGPGIDRPRVEASIATAFAHLYRVQSAQLHRPDVTEAQLRSSAACTKSGATDSTAIGPGNDWRCVVSWHIPGATAVGSATYQLDMAAEGRYIADGDGPAAVNGFFPVHTPSGDAPNPLWQVDGLVDLLSPAATKG